MGKGRKRGRVLLQMLQPLLRGLGVLELLVVLLRRPLLGWFGARRADAAAGLLALLLAARLPPPRYPLLRAPLWLLALPLQLLLASVRGLLRSPARIYEAEGPARCEQLRIPLADGEVPALLLHPDGPPRAALLLAHGSGDHKRHYTWRIIGALLEGGFAVCAIDLDGHGESRRVLDVPGVEQSVAGALCWLRQRYQRVGVVGISLGGCVAARALAQGAHADALALLESPARLFLPPGYIQSELRGLLRAEFWSFADGSTPLSLLRAWPAPPIVSRLSTYDVIARLDLPEAAARLRCPTLLLYGDRDMIAPLDHGLWLLARAPGATLMIAPGASHLSLTMEQAPLDALVAWLGQQL